MPQSSGDCLAADLLTSIPAYHVYLVTLVPLGVFHNIRMTPTLVFTIHSAIVCIVSMGPSIPRALVPTKPFPRVSNNPCLRRLTCGHSHGNYPSSLNRKSR
ncbi:hypothetical protein DEU56DRAFT_805765 [Suillus clintonianus]|uniref:uncharacterized protein n=1 Tax=Suillus clintonianus TaxID=1904413 RepID=UPI001B86DCB8|nr:uncharacterized protein DEU56DRAFT_805765 [Suillus clintonianus]KAG2136408.1 hypothetical protein DEU56DRAFT_805765 [Suillus clintonianus]